MLRGLFTHSIDTGTVLCNWKSSDIVPVFKKVNRSLPYNYRPISLTSIYCKLLEHNICTCIIDHLDFFGFLSPYQHGFRKNHSCQNQLIGFIDDLHHFIQKHRQVDVMFLDFAKSFDKVPHNRLLLELSNY